MRFASAALALAVAAVVTAASRPAAADGLYFTEGAGGTHFKNEITAYLQTATRIRVSLGYRHANTSIELWGGADFPSDAFAPSLSLFGLDVKHMFPLSSHFEAYLRGSMSRAAGDSEGALAGYQGRGLGFGAGVQLKGHAPLLMLLYPPIALVCLIPDACKKLGPKGTIALFADEGYDFYRLHDPARGPAIDVEATRWTIGFAIGSDF